MSHLGALGNLKQSRSLPGPGQYNVVAPQPEGLHGPLALASTPHLFRKLLDTFISLRPSELFLQFNREYLPPFYGLLRAVLGWCCWPSDSTDASLCSAFSGGCPAGSSLIADAATFVGSDACACCTAVTGLARDAAGVCVDSTVG